LSNRTRSPAQRGRGRPWILRPSSSWRVRAG